tara:strand:+ start:437 stop:1369 length:933 start_codon:yes stop_codon:yes gene_type:complete
MFRKAHFIGRNMSLAPSIDNFLHTHSRDELLIRIGKILIAAVIGAAEANSTLFQSRIDDDDNFALDFSATGYVKFSGKGYDVQPAGASWLAKIFWLLVSGRTFTDFKQALSRISFICFNYDRCIEQFISVASRSYFELDDGGTREVLDLIDIIHPYGKLGPLDFKHNSLTNFGDILDASKIIDASGQLQTFGEGGFASDVTDSIATKLTLAKTAVFLGFGFLPLNLNRVLMGRSWFISNVLGTSLGQSDATTSLISESLSRSFRRKKAPDGTGWVFGSTASNVELSPLRCSELIDHHWWFLQSEIGVSSF